MAKILFKHRNDVAFGESRKQHGKEEDFFFYLI